MTGILPWILLFSLLFFFGIFFMIQYSLRTQEKALQAIFQQLQATRIEVDRLAKTLDALLTDRELEDDDTLVPTTPIADPNTLVPGLDKLLLNDPPPPMPELKL